MASSALDACASISRPGSSTVYGEPRADDRERRRSRRRRACDLRASGPRRRTPDRSVFESDVSLIGVRPPSGSRHSSLSAGARPRLQPHEPGVYAGDNWHGARAELVSRPRASQRSAVRSPDTICCTARPSAGVASTSCSSAASAATRRPHARRMNCPSARTASCSRPGAASPARRRGDGSGGPRRIARPPPSSRSRGRPAERHRSTTSPSAWSRSRRCWTTL